MDESFCFLFGDDDGVADIEDTFSELKLNVTNNQLPPEVEEGNIEYKLKLIDPTAARLAQLVTQMKWRLREGRGEAIYQIGVEDKGNVAGLSEEDLDSSLETLKEMAERLDATIKIIRTRTVDYENGEKRFSAEVHVRKVPDDQQFIEVRIAVTGHMEVGKSTLLGVLTHGETDNGRGRARLDLFRHLHEMKSGRTSSISQEILGFDCGGNMVNYSTMRKTEEICQASSKLITFIDLAGHPKYMKTTVFGLTGQHPDITMLVVSAACGAVGTFHEHLSYALALKVPICLIINKVDVCSKEQLRKTIIQLQDTLKQMGCNLKPSLIETEDDADLAAAKIYTLSVAPIFTVSAVSGHNLDLIIRFLNLVLPKMTQPEVERREAEPIEFHIDEVYSVTGTGTVVSGYLKEGIIREGDYMKVGPAEDGSYKQIQISTIQRKRAACRLVRPGQVACIASKHLHRDSVRIGMVGLGLERDCLSCMEFVADTYLIYHTTNFITSKFRLTVYINSIRQQAIIFQIEDDILEPGNQKKVHFRFTRHPEYLSIGTKILFREGTTKGIGTVTNLLSVNTLKVPIQ
ncbi:hypothetical protein LOD99_14882 [Oopsacas minuta]|uniref:Tr-type G domain-containing protein n=1 Tax=Oopsacas minuta TaxID=111878 RepID=A0AAV7KGJ6_9METZ|nr:hypothetical protein LOD99_14882 [Oopsacas minuta]